jgi:hypothetical protein
VKVDARKSSSFTVAQAGPVAQTGPVGSGTGLRCGIDILPTAAAPSSHPNTAANGTDHAYQSAVHGFTCAITVAGGFPDRHPCLKPDCDAVADGDRATADAGTDPG